MTKNVLLVECLTRRSNLTGILIHLAANVYISIQWRKINVCRSAFLCNKVSSFLCKGIVADYKSATTTIIAWFLEARCQLYLNVLFTTSSCNYRRKTYETYPYKKKALFIFYSMANPKGFFLSHDLQIYDQICFL